MKKMGGMKPGTFNSLVEQFPDWQVIGVDRDFAPYIVYDHEGNYACFDRHGHFQYFQPRPGAEGLALYANPDKTRMQFTKIFSDLSQVLPGTDGKKSKTFEKNGNKIIQHHIRDFETGNMTFKESEIGEVQLPSARVVRCMNVLLYAKTEPRKKMLQWLSELLCDGGILIAGTNGNDMLARYMVYRKKDDETTAEEFSFSPDNLRPFGIMPWFTIHERDPEATYLAQLIGALRADPTFWPAFSRRFDHLLAKYGICRRSEDGYLHPLAAQLPGTEFMLKMKQIWQQIIGEDYVEGAVEALRQRGYTAWENQVGDISVRPPVCTKSG